MKKLLILFLMAMSVCSSQAATPCIIYGSDGYSYISNGIYYEIYASGNYILSVCSEYQHTAAVFPTETYVGDIVIPAEIEIEEGVSGEILKIKQYAFANCDITSIFVEYRKTRRSDNPKFDYLCFSVDANAFYNCTKLEEITICCDIIEFISNALDGCSSLHSLKINCPEPPKTWGDFDFSVLKNCTLYVPIGSKELYEETPYWTEFQNIEEYDFSELINQKSSNNNVSQSK